MPKKLTNFFPGASLKRCCHPVENPYIMLFNSSDIRHNAFIFGGNTKILKKCPVNKESKISCSKVLPLQIFD